MTDRALIERLRSSVAEQGDPKAVYRTRPVALFEEAADRLEALTGGEAEAELAQELHESGGRLGRSPTQRSDGDDATIWRVCQVLRGECSHCPASEMVAGDACVRGCRLQAIECVNVVETGNPWRREDGVNAPWISFALEKDWPISTDGHHSISDTRRWLARQLMDSTLSEAEALGAVAHNPAVKAAMNLPSLDGGAEAFFNAFRIEVAPTLARWEEQSAATQERYRRALALYFGTGSR